MTTRVIYSISCNVLLFQKLFFVLEVGAQVCEGALSCVLGALCEVFYQ